MEMAPEGPEDMAQEGPGEVAHGGPGEEEPAGEVGLLGIAQGGLPKPAPVESEEHKPNETRSTKWAKNSSMLAQAFLTEHLLLLEEEREKLRRERMAFEE